MTGENNSMFVYRILHAVAVVAIAFSVVVSVLMISRLITVRTSSPLDLTEIEQLRSTLRDNPADDAVKAKIRDLDLLARRFYFGGLSSLRTGSYLLLCGVAVSLACLKTMAVLRRRRNNPLDYAPVVEEARSSAAARLITGGTVVALLTAAILVGVLEKPRGRIAASQVARIGTAESVTNWPGFRGMQGAGVSAFTNLPVSWDVKTRSNVFWMAKVPLPGMSSPVVWGNRIFVTGASEEMREVYCFDLASGTMLWRARADPTQGSTKLVPKVLKDTGFAASTCVTDGMLVYAIFANGDLVALDYCEKPVWALSLGLPDNRYGYCSSLAMYEDRLFVQFDTDSEGGKVSELIALDAGTGKKAWSTARPVTDSWPSPVVLNTAAGPQLITMANDWIIAYEPVNGTELWKVKCSGSDVAPTPILAGGLVIAAVTSDKTYAIRPDGHGDVTSTHVAWTSESGVGDVASPVSNGELIFMVQSGGTLTCLEVKTGKVVWEKSLEGEFYASPGLAGDRLYLVARSGEVFILKAGPQYEVVGMAKLGEPSDCSPAFVKGRIIVRGITHLFCIGNEGM